MIVYEGRSENCRPNTQTKAEGATVKGLVAGEEPGVGVGGVLCEDCLECDQQSAG